MYKAYPPHRGDDISALLELAQAMPPGTKYVPIQPRDNLVTDLRVLLPDLVCQGLLGEDLVLSKLAGTRAKRTPGDRRKEFDEKSRDQLVRLIRRALDWEKMSGKTAEKVVDDLQEANRGLYEALLVWIEGDGGKLQQEEPVAELSKLVEAEEGDGPGLYKGIQDWIERNQQFSTGEKMERFVHIPPDKPLLVLGRPDLFRRFVDPTSPLRTALDGAAYPNRFDLPGRERGAQQGQYIVRDRKSRLIYQVASDQWMDADVGFVFANVGGNGQWVVVASGASSLGTFCSAHLLSQDRPGFDEAVQRCREAEGTRPVDIGFASRYTQLSRYRPFRHVIEPDDLQIDLLNPRDLDGYRWLQRNEDEFKCLTLSWDPGPPASDPVGEEKEEPTEEPTEESAEAPAEEDEDKLEPLQDRFMHWTWSPVRVGHLEDGEEIRIIDVEVKAETVEIPGRRPIILSEPLGTLIDRIDKHVTRDSTTWLERLEGAAGAGGLRSYEEMRNDPAFQTMSPILLLGETGTGKKWISELIGKLWGGQTLRAGLEEARRAWEDSTPKPGTKWNPHRLLPGLLKKALPEWAARAGKKEGAGEPPPIHDSLYTVAILDRPRGLLESELHGIYVDVATDVGASLGAFLTAGTGILLLDEFLELDPAMQASLLVALDTGRVHPVGGPGPYPYLSRVVAATNRASSLAELQALIDQDEVRSDLVARFPRRYSIPPLAGRPREVVPILAGILDQMKKGEGHLRISRRAFEVLACHPYPENIRELEALARDFSDELIENCTKPIAGAGDLEKTDSAIRLEHLGRLGVSDCRPGLRHGSIKCERETEDEFYDFNIRPLSELEEREPGGEELVGPDPVVELLSSLAEEWQTEDWEGTGGGSAVDAMRKLADECRKDKPKGPGPCCVVEHGRFEDLILHIGRRVTDAGIGAGDLRDHFTQESWTDESNELQYALPLPLCSGCLKGARGKARRAMILERIQEIVDGDKVLGETGRSTSVLTTKIFLILCGQDYE